MDKKFKTSQRVSILDEQGRVLHRGAVVRSFNPEAVTYHVTMRTEEELLTFQIPAGQFLDEC